MTTREFTVTIEGKEVEFVAKSPTLQNQREAQKVYNQAFTDAVRSKCVVRAKLDDLLKEQGLWNETKQALFNELQKELADGEKRLAKGGFNISEAKKLALRMRIVREEIKDLISVRTSLDNHSAEGQADNSRFNYLVSACVVYKDSNQPYFSSMEDYLNRADDQVAILGAQNLANMLYGLDNDFEKNLPENKFLTKFKFVDAKLRLVNKDGHLVNEDGKLIDENGRFVDADGNFVDKDGNRVDAGGEYILESQPFLDDNGNPIILEEEKENKDENSAKPKKNKEAKAEPKQVPEE
jgi:hypothetical protein